jgi:hypothetical protein
MARKARLRFGDATSLVSSCRRPGAWFGDKREVDQIHAAMQRSKLPQTEVERGSAETAASRWISKHSVRIVRRLGDLSVAGQHCGW